MPHIDTENVKESRKFRCQIQQRSQKFLIVSMLDLLRMFPLTRKSIGSGMKRVATGSDSVRYQTLLFAVFLKKSLENVKLFFDIIRPIFSIQQATSEIASKAVQYAFQS